MSSLETLQLGLPHFWPNPAMASIGVSHLAVRMSVSVRCWHCSKPIRLRIWRWWVRKVRCQHCLRVNKITKRWVAERVEPVKQGFYG